MDPQPQDGAQPDAAPDEPLDPGCGSIFDSGVLNIPYLPPPWFQRLLPVSLLPVVVAAVGLLTAVFLPSLGWTANISPLPRGTAVVTLCAAIAWLVTHWALVVRQRRAAIALAEAAWHKEHSLEGVAKFCSLVFSYAGYSRRSLECLWPHLGGLGVSVFTMKLEADISSMPVVWVIDDAPVTALMRFAESRGAVLRAHVRMGRFALGPGDWIAVSSFGGMIIGVLPGYFPSLPWSTRGGAIWIGLTAGFLVGFGLAYLMRGHQRFLMRIRGFTLLYRRRLWGEPEKHGPFEVTGMQCVVGPSYSFPHGVPRRSPKESKVLIRTLGLPMLQFEINEDAVVELPPA